ncbi:MAG: DUF4367 domain-containing protein [Oscillospiraceae bacterium]
MRNKDNSIPDYEYLRNMDTAQLQALLEQESFLSDDDSFDAELVKRIVTVLDERDPIFDDFNAEDSLRLFNDEILPELEKEKSDSELAAGGIIRKRSRRRMKTLLIAAVFVGLLGVMFAAGAMGSDFWSHIINWGKETFQIGSSMEASSEAPSENPNEGEGTAVVGNTSSYKTYDEAMKAFSISILVPNWVPEGFGISDIQTSETPHSITLTALYECEDKILLFNAVMYDTSGAEYVFEKDDGSGETVVINGIEHYFMTNLEQKRAVWIKDNCVYSISGNVTFDDLEKMLNSIYEGEK